MPSAAVRLGKAVAGMPPTSFFLTSAVFHYLGPSLAVLLFAHLSALGVAWLRIMTAAVVFACWRRPWGILRSASTRQRSVFAALGCVLAGMNSLFYLAVDRLPLSTVGAIEFVGVLVLAAAGTRTRRNLVALLLAVGGVFVLTDLRLTGEPLGFVFAFGNCAGFMLYVVLGHRVATTTPDGGASPGPLAAPMNGIDQLAAAMLIAALAATPIGLAGALPAFTHPLWLAWGVGVGICSSVIPYVTDQLAMARLPRATFALLLALLPATATGIGLLVLAQVPTVQDLLGVGLVVAGVALHRDAAERCPVYDRAMLVELYADPTCPWCWPAYRWLDEVRADRDLRVVLRPFSLAIRDATAELPPPVRAARDAGRRALRVMTALPSDDARYAFYGAFASPVFAALEAGQLPRPDIAAALAAAGLDTSLAAVADVEAGDDAIRASMAEAGRLWAGQDGEVVRIPMLVLHSPAGATVFRGPLLDPVPTAAQAHALWDAVERLADVPPLVELSRPHPPVHSLVSRLTH